MKDSRTHHDTLRALPSVDVLLRHRLLRGVAARSLAADIVREVLDEARRDITDGAASPDIDALAEAAARRIDEALASPLVPLINATGVIIHTNLGRAPLAREAIDAMTAASEGYSNLEFDLPQGTRGSRHTLLAPLIRRATGAEAGMAVNNNASALLLALSALAAGKEVVISRGQLVEIGGGFRIPDVMKLSRAKLIEVGTTNRTRAADFDEAIGPRTAAILRVHSSNFRIVGFTEEPTLAALAEVARRRGVLLIDDIGSGCFLDTTVFGLPREPTPQASIAAGADVVVFSGDKLLGGPQGGLIAGTSATVERMKKHPLARAVRLDKASIAGLAVTLRIHLEGAATEKLPVWQMIAAPLVDLQRRAEAIAQACGGAVVEGKSMIGGGSLPEESLPTALVSFTNRGAAAAAARLRLGGIVARMQDGALLLDPRTIAPEDDARVIVACRTALK